MVRIARKPKEKIELYERGKQRVVATIEVDRGCTLDVSALGWLEIRRVNAEGKVSRRRFGKY